MSQDEKHVVLFDEHGTPTFVEERESDSFVGISCLYATEDEFAIFNACDTVFGLSNVRRRKNNRISKSNALEIAKCVGTQPIQIVVNKIDLRNSELQSTAQEYEAFGNNARTKHRGVRNRPLAQILHTKMLDTCLFQSIVNDLEKKSNKNCHYELFIDNWSFPKNDDEISLEYRSESLEQKIQALLSKLNKGIKISISHLNVLKEDSKRKRFIDVLASIVSRAYLKPNHERASEDPIEVLANLSGSNFREDDITAYEVQFMKKFMSMHSQI